LHFELTAGVSASHFEFGAHAPGGHRGVLRITTVLNFELVTLNSRAQRARNFSAAAVSVSVIGPA
jgi:hypothetical protein